MNRFFLESSQFDGDRVIFPGEIAHQVIHVLRLTEGDKVEVLDNTCTAFEVIIINADQPELVTGKIIGQRKIDSEASIKVSLFFGLTQRDKVEWILQKGTELGLNAFYPFISAHTRVTSVSMPDQKFDRWKRIIRESAEQSGRGLLPTLHQPQKLDSCLDQINQLEGRALAAWEAADPGTQTIHEGLSGFSGLSISLLIGPEGGFNKKEIQQITNAGCRVVSLGKRILRMETAAIIFPALVMYELGE